jgi:hypothetical protein
VIWKSYGIWWRTECDLKNEAALNKAVEFEYTAVFRNCEKSKHRLEDRKTQPKSNSNA